MPTKVTKVHSPYNVSLASVSPLFVYRPVRDTDAEKGWNATYTEDFTPTGQPPARVNYRRTHAGGVYISLTFEGTGFYFCINAGGATYALTVDSASVEGSAPASGDRACDHTQGNADTLLYARGLAYGAHAVLLVVTYAAPEREFRFFGGVLEIGVQTGGKAVNDSMLVDDLASGWTLFPGRGLNKWDIMKDGHFVANGVTFDCVYDVVHTATYTFSGAGGAVLLGGIWPQLVHGFSVQLDDAAPINLDAAAGSFVDSTPFFLTGALDPTVEHSITVRDFNSDMPKCTFDMCCVLVDAVRLLRAAGEDGDLPGVDLDPPSSTQPERPSGSTRTGADPVRRKTSWTGAIAGGAGGAVFALVLVAFLVIVLRRRQRRRRSAAENGQPSQGQIDHLSPYTLSGSPSPRPTTEDSKRLGLFDKEPHSVSGSSTLDTARGHLSPPPASEPDRGSVRPRMEREDLELVLAFVAQRMDRSAPRVAQDGDGHANLPEYSG